jgi:phosphatidylglycerol---prolipoprotein diacylglyceryl transferase
MRRGMATAATKTREVAPAATEVPPSPAVASSAVLRKRQLRRQDKRNRDHQRNQPERRAKPRVALHLRTLSANRGGRARFYTIRRRDGGLRCNSLPTRRFSSVWAGVKRTRYTRAVIPFLHVGPIEIPTFGLMVAVAMIVAYYVLRADMARRGIAEKDSATAEIFIVVPALAGIAGAKLYHVLETPRELFAHPFDELLSRYGLAWFGGLIGGFAAWVLLARAKRISLLGSLDAGSAAAALGYGVGRLGCLLSGDGDYGVPTSLPWGMSFPNGLVPTRERVHPTPIYELIVACVMAWFLWRLGTKQVADREQMSAAGRPSDSSGANAYGGKTDPRRQRPDGSASSTDSRARWQRPGSVFAAYLLLTGSARFMVEFIRINPRSFFGLTNAQVASVACVIAGATLFWTVSRGR